MTSEGDAQEYWGGLLNGVPRVDKNKISITDLHVHEMKSQWEETTEIKMNFHGVYLQSYFTVFLKICISNTLLYLHISMSGDSLL
jgi:hypothetical protein